MGELDTLRSGRRAARVVDRRDRVLAAVPRPGVRVVAQQHASVSSPITKRMRCVHAGERLVELRVDEQHRRARVLDDVAHLVGVQTEVDRHDDTPVARHGEQRGHHASAVLGDDRHPLAEPDAERVEPCCHGAHADRDLVPGELAPARGRLVRFVDDADAVAEDGLGAIEEVEDVERDVHGASGQRRRRPLTRAAVAQLLGDARLSRPVRFARWPCCRCSGRSSAGTTSSRLFSGSLVDPRAHGFVIHGRQASARPAWPTSASRWPTRRDGSSRGRPRPRAHAARRSARSPTCCRPASATTAATSSPYVAEVRPVLREQATNGPARAVRRRPPPPRHHVGDAWSASSSTPTSSSWSARSAPRRRSRRHSSRCGSGLGCAGSTSTTSIAPRSTRSSTSSSVARSRRARSWRSGRQPGQRPVRPRARARRPRRRPPHRPARRVAARPVRSWRRRAAAASSSLPGSALARGRRSLTALDDAGGVGADGLGRARGTGRLETRSSCSTARASSRCGPTGAASSVTLAAPALRRDPPGRMPALTRRRLLLEHADRIDALRRPPPRGRHPCGDRAPRGDRRADPTLLLEGRPARSVRPGLPAGASASAEAAGARGHDARGRAAARRGAARARRVRRGRRAC